MRDLYDLTLEIEAAKVQQFAPNTNWEECMKVAEAINEKYAIIAIWGLYEDSSEQVIGLVDTEDEAKALSEKLDKFVNSHLKNDGWIVKLRFYTIPGNRSWKQKERRFL